MRGDEPRPRCRGFAFCDPLGRTAPGPWEPSGLAAYDGIDARLRLPGLGRKSVVWVPPDLVIEVVYRGWTSDGLVRHASLKRVREDKAPREVVRGL